MAFCVPAPDVMATTSPRRWFLTSALNCVCVLSLCSLCLFLLQAAKPYSELTLLTNGLAPSTSVAMWLPFGSPYSCVTCLIPEMSKQGTGKPEASSAWTNGFKGHYFLLELFLKVPLNVLFQLMSLTSPSANTWTALWGLMVVVVVVGGRVIEKSD